MIIEAKTIRMLFTAAALALLSSCQYNLETLFLYDPGSDPDAPTIISTTPARDAHMTTLSSVSVTFSEEVIGAEILSNYTLNGSGAASLSLLAVTDLGSNTYELTLAGPTIDGDINIDVSDISDVGGNIITTDRIRYLGWWDTNWSNRIKLRFDNSGQSEALADFTALVKLNSTRVDYSAAQANGNDIRFLDDNRGLLNHETERWDSSGISSLWVNIPDISGLSDTDYIWMYYGNSSAGNGENTSAAWNGDFGAVWHFNSITAVPDDYDVLDSSVNNRDAKAENIGSVTSSDIGFGYFFDNDVPTPNNWVNPLDPSAPGSYFNDEIFDRSVEIRFQSALIAGNQTLYEEGGSGNGFYVGLDGSSVVTVAKSSAQTPISTAFSDTSSYHTLVAVYDGQSGPTSIVTQYLDGLPVSAVPSFTTIGSHSNGPGIGRTESSDSYGGTTGRYFSGIIDEMRISNVALSADWISAQNLSMSDSFITYTNE